jgi:regulator of protease activity HflC (stomatin/prohibitin superfamily)
MKKLLLLLVLLSGCTQIDTGNVGIERTLGKVNESALPAGIYMTMFKTVDEFTTKEVSFQLNDMTPKSKDNLTMQDVDIDIYFKAMPQSIPALYIKYQGDVIEYGDLVKGGGHDYVMGFNRVSREAREAIYKTISLFDATTMHTKRAEVAESIREILQQQLDANDKASFVITAVNVRNLLTDKAIENAIRQKAETDQAIDKKRKEIELSKAEAERMIVEAQGIARSNQIISESMTPMLKEIRLAELLRDTAFSVSGKPGNVIMLNGNATPLINIK